MENEIDYEMDFGGDVNSEIENQSVPNDSQEVSDEYDASADAPSEEEREERIRRNNLKPAKTRINQIQREKYQALDEANRLREENEELRRMVDLSTQAAQQYYDNDVYNRLERAKQLKAQAKEAGDVESEINADLEMALAANEISNVNNYKAQQAYQSQQRYPQQQIEPPHLANAKQLNEWVNKNSWFHPESEDYDENLAREIQVHADLLDVNLHRAGHQDKIMSREYFNEIDKAVKALRERDSSAYYPSRSNLNMKPSRDSVAPVRNGMSERAERSGQYKLNADQKDLIRRLGISEKQYIKSEIDSRKKNPNKWAGYR